MAEILSCVPIRSDPPGARVYRGPIGAATQDWELLGVTPLDSVRFVRGAGYYLRLEADGHRTVELMQSAVQPTGMPTGPRPLDPVKLDPESRLPATMVRVPGFTLAGVNYADYFMDRYEVTNREYKAFVDAGGYGNRHLLDRSFPERPGGGCVGGRDGLVQGRDRPHGPYWRLGTYPDGQADHPVGGVKGTRQPHMPGSPGRSYRQPHTGRRHSASIGGTAGLSRRAATAGSGPRPVGKPGALNAFGLADIVGNVREWCFNEVGSGRATRGGAWTDDTFFSGWIIRKDPFDRDATHGFRLVRTFDDAATLGRLRQPDAATELRDYRKEKPVAESEFAIFRRLYEYDKPAPPSPWWRRPMASSTGFVKRSPSIFRTAANEAAPTSFFPGMRHGRSRP